MIIDPRKASPDSIMPRVPLTTNTAQLITNFLLQQEESAVQATYLSPAENPLIPFEDGIGPLPESAQAKSDYLNYCAACHGSTGQGDGFNAQFLPVQPTRHADPAHMSSRPDDTLYDGIHAGGYILNKSPLMPPWGESLASKDIRGLVRFMRSLCQCEGPSWSLDN
jgi:cytochrome c553